MDGFVYQYLVGSIVFVIGLIYGWRQGYLGFSGRPLRNLVVVVAGLLGFASVQGWLQYAPMTEATFMAYDGQGLPDGMLGSPIDYVIMVGYFVAMLGALGLGSGGTKRPRDFFWWAAVQLVADWHELGGHHDWLVLLCEVQQHCLYMGHCKQPDLPQRLVLDSPAAVWLAAHFVLQPRGQHPGVL